MILVIMVLAVMLVDIREMKVQLLMKLLVEQVVHNLLVVDLEKEIVLHLVY